MRMTFEDIESRRGSDAFEFLMEGELMQIENLWISKEEGVYVVTSWNNLPSKAVGMSELNKGIKQFQVLCRKWKPLGNYFSGKEIKFELISDYGTGSVGLSIEKTQLV